MYNIKHVKKNIDFRVFKINRVFRVNRVNRVFNLDPLFQYT